MQPADLVNLSLYWYLWINDTALLIVSVVVVAVVPLNPEYVTLGSIEAVISAQFKPLSVLRCQLNEV